MQTLTVEQDVDRIFQRWKRRVIPGRVLREILYDWPITVATERIREVSKHCLANRTIFVRMGLSRSEETEALVREWIRYRIHEKSGRPPEPTTADFVERWTESFLLPQDRLEKHQIFRALHWDWIHGGAGLNRRQAIRDLAEHFWCTPGLATSALRRRYFGGSVIPFRPRGLVRACN